MRSDPIASEPTCLNMEMEKEGILELLILVYYLYAMLVSCLIIIDANRGEMAIGCHGEVVRIDSISNMMNRVEKDGLAVSNVGDFVVGDQDSRRCGQ